MLVLTRKINESICIDGGIEVMVVAIRGNKVRLGFRAPSEVSIQRKERAGHLPGDVRAEEELAHVGAMDAAHVRSPDRLAGSSFHGHMLDD